MPAARLQINIDQDTAAAILAALVIILPAFAQLIRASMNLWLKRIEAKIDANSSRLRTMTGEPEPEEDTP